MKSKCPPGLVHGRAALCFRAYRLLLVVDRNVRDLLALCVGRGSGDCPRLAISGDDDATGQSRFAAFFSGDC